MEVPRYSVTSAPSHHTIICRGLHHTYVDAKFKSPTIWEVLGIQIRDYMDSNLVLSFNQNRPLIGESETCSILLYYRVVVRNLNRPKVFLTVQICLELAHLHDAVWNVNNGVFHILCSIIAKAAVPTNFLKSK